MAAIDVLVAVRQENAKRYYENLTLIKDFRVRVVSKMDDAHTELADKDHNTDVIILDNSLDGAFDAVSVVRQKYARILIVLVDEDADFALPGQADDISTDPFTNGDLARRINRLMSDRRLETLRADAMPPVRAFAKQLRKAVGEIGKQQAAVAACRELGYEYVAFYRVEKVDPLTVTLKAQDGSAAIQAVAPKQAEADDLIGWVALNGQSRLANHGDELNHPLVKKGRLGSVAITPVGTTNRYGVLVVAHERPGAITMQDVLLVELIAAQLAAVGSKE
jgi:hypothetical protein